MAQNVEFRFQSSASCQASSLRSSTSAKPLDPPALFTRMWIAAEALDVPSIETLDVGLRLDVAGEEHRPIATAERFERGRALVGIAPGDHHAWRPRRGTQQRSLSRFPASRR